MGLMLMKRDLLWKRNDLHYGWSMLLGMDGNYLCCRVGRGLRLKRRTKVLRFIVFISPPAFWSKYSGIVKASRTCLVWGWFYKAQKVFLLRWINAQMRSSVFAKASIKWCQIRYARKWLSSENNKNNTADKHARSCNRTEVNLTNMPTSLLI